MNSDSNVSLAYATFPDDACARRVCTTLVSEGLVRCANVLAPHASIYRWDSELKTDVEVGALLKINDTHRERLATRFVELHPFDVPALVYWSVTGGANPFLKWLREV